MIADTRPKLFYGWRVVSAAFVLAVFGWGMGFYGPPVFLNCAKLRAGRSPLSRRPSPSTS